VHTHYYYIVRTTRERSTNAMKCCVELFHFSISILIIGFLFVVCRCYARLHPRAVNCRKRSCGHTNQVSSTIPNLLIQQCCAPPNLLQQQQIILSLSLVTHTHSLVRANSSAPRRSSNKLFAYAYGCCLIGNKTLLLHITLPSCLSRSSLSNSS
jgi:hypothetical protein